MSYTLDGEQNWINDLLRGKYGTLSLGVPAFQSSEFTSLTVAELRDVGLSVVLNALP